MDNTDRHREIAIRCFCSENKKNRWKSARIGGEKTGLLDSRFNRN